MKTIKALLFYTTLTLACLQNTSCNKEDDIMPTGEDSNKKPPEANWTIHLPPIRPADFIFLDATAAFSSNGQIARFKWSKVSGPSSYQIGNPDSAVTKVSNLEEGMYQFKLLVTDNKGISSDSIKGIEVVDHVQFILIDPTTLIFTDLKKENDPVGQIEYMQTAPLPNGFDANKIKTVLLFGGIGSILPNPQPGVWFVIEKDGTAKYKEYYKIENNRIIVYAYYDNNSRSGLFFYIANTVKAVF